VVVLLASGCVGLAWIATQHERRALETEVGKRGQTLVLNLAGVAKDPLLQDDDLSLERLVREAGREEGVVAARLLGRKGQIRASLEPVEVGRVLKPMVGAGLEHGLGPIVERRARLLRAAAPIRWSGVLVGEAQVELDLASLVDPVVRETEHQLALVAMTVVLIGVLAGLVFVALLVEPLRRLRAGVERLTAGDLTVRVPPTSRDEVGELSHAFNAMGEALQQKERIQNAFGRYVNDYVLEQLLSSPEGEDVCGAEREVTILFADIRSFTRLSEGMKARDVVALLNDVFQLVSDHILSSHGTIDKFIGDSVMAYFGAPVPEPDHAQHAVSAAIEIQRALAERSRRRPGSGAGSEVEVSIGVGIHTGVVVVGSIGSKRRVDFTAIGDAVNVAHRLEKLARPGEILVSEAVQRRVRGAFRLYFQGERQLSGRLEPVHVYNVESSPTTPNAAENA
jgi:class 3 adenylate cyclase